MRTLLIDDVRAEESVQAVISVIARDYWEAIRQIDNNGPWDVILLDHDLGNFDDNNKELTGRDVAEYIASLPETSHPRVVKVITSNPVGRENIIAALHKTNIDVIPF